MSKTTGAPRQPRPGDNQTPIFAAADPRPSWFQEPGVDAQTRVRRSGEYQTTLASVVTELAGGFFSLPPWQRDAVWTEEQRIRLLDSLVRGVSIGPITLWRSLDPTLCRAFPNLPVVDDACPVIDGQQRLTTLAMAASGALDHWHWNGRTWTTGAGFMAPSHAVTHHDLTFFDIARGCDLAVRRRMLEDRRIVKTMNITFIVLDGTVECMLDTYERLATSGSPHSTENLAVMRNWRSGR